MPESQDAQFAEVAFTETKELLRQLSEARKAAETSSGEERQRALRETTRLAALAEQKNASLYERVSPFERLLSLREQYERQKNLMERLGILERLSTGELGIRTIMGQEAPFPTLREVSTRLKAVNVSEQGQPKKFLERKIDEGLNRLRITPFGMPLVTLDASGNFDLAGSSLASRYGAKLREKHTAGLLSYTKQNPFDEDEEAERIPATEFDAVNPLYIADEYKGPTKKGADIEGTLFYSVADFNTNPTIHHGTTKPAILTSDPRKAWLITLAEPFYNIPRSGNAKQTGPGRTQIDTHGTQIAEYITPGQTIPSLSDYLSAFRGEKPENTRYKGERGQIPEEQLIEALLFLEETNQVLHDYRGHGSINYLLGAMFTNGGVPFFYWGRVSHRSYLYWYNPVDRNDDCGVRSVAGESPK